MKTNRIVLLLIISTFSLYAKAQNLKVTCLADFNNHEIGAICQKNTDDLLKAFNSCSTFHLSRMTLRTDSVDEGTLLKHISENLPASSFDISVFYFSGIYKKGDNHYPLIKLGSKWTNSKLFYELVQNKPGLSIIIIDGVSEKCNSKLTIDPKLFSPCLVLDTLLSSFTGNIYLAGNPTNCTLTINDQNTLLTKLFANKFEKTDIKLNWKSFFTRIKAVQQTIATTNNINEPDISWKINVENRKQKIKPIKPESVDSVITFDNIPVGINVSKKLGDPIVKIIQKPDSVTCKQIVAKIDSTGGKGKEFTYTVPVNIGSIALELHSILRFIVLADETYSTNSVIKHQFEPILSFTFYKNNDKVMLLYSPSNQSFGFGYKNSLVQLTYQNKEHTEKIFNDILKHIHHE